jgi:RNase H-fold protein (predicted Holliday junction resolvase)
MCIICIDLEKERLSTQEAFRNLNEMYDSLEEEHVKEVVEILFERLHSRMNDEDEESDLWDGLGNFIF